MTIPLNFRTQCARAHVSPYFFRTLSVYVFIAFLFCFVLFVCFFFFDFLCSFTSHSQAVTVCARAQPAVLRSSGHSVREISKLFKNAEQWVRNKCSRRPSIFTNCARNRITKAKYERNNSTRKIAKKLQHHNINVYSATVWRLTNKE